MLKLFTKLFTFIPKHKYKNVSYYITKPDVLGVHCDMLKSKCNLRVEKNTVQS